jgi:hypothetical protein
VSRKSSVATAVAAAAMVVAPGLMKLGSGRSVAAMVASSDSTEQCIRTATEVHQRADGAEVGIKLAKGARVETLAERNDWSRISYSSGGRAHVGWISSDDLGDCMKPKPAKPAAPDVGDVDSNEPGETDDGDWSTYNGCPLQGNAKQPLALSINPLKNRFEAPSAINGEITLDKILAPGNDETRWTTHDAATVEGWVIYVQKGGFETCNCKSHDPQYMDTHIGNALTAKEARKNHHMIVEVTPRWRAIMAERGVDWSTETLVQTLVGKHVRITGWLLYDGEHFAEAENTAPGHAGNWRASAWEIHPITAIDVLPE